MKLTLTRPLPGDVASRLSAHFSEVRVLSSPRPPSLDELKLHLPGTDVLICSLTERVDAALLAAAPALKHISTFSVGVDHLDIPAIRARGISVSHTPGVLTDATADLAWTLILACARKLKPAMQFIEEGKFTGFSPTAFLGLELRGAILGIVGMGKIGSAVAKRAEGFGMSVYYSGPAKALPNHVELEELLRISDVVSLHCPLNDKTRHLVSRRELGVMKPKAVLVNTARGPIVDEAALVAHLRSHPEFTAGLDVFEREPGVTAGLAVLPNAVCLPHVGSATLAARTRMAEICVDEAIRFVKGEALQNEYTGS